jgi:hypothetical protein
MPQVQNWFAALFTGLLLLWALIQWGDAMSKKVKIDDILVLVVVVFGIAGPLYSTPRFHSIALWIKQTFLGAASGASSSGGANLVAIIGAALVITMAGLFLKKPSWKRLIWLVAATLPLFTNETMQALATLWTNDVASILFRVLMSVVNWIAGYGWVNPLPQ